MPSPDVFEMVSWFLNAQIGISDSEIVKDSANFLANVD